MNSIPNLKYKTTVCQKWEAQQPCSKGFSCYFAHGPEELRTVEQNQQIIGYRNHYFKAYSEQYNVPSNYKTIKCKFYGKGQCKLSDSCSFYHSLQQKRPTTQSQSYDQTQYSDWLNYHQYAYGGYYFNGLTQESPAEDSIEEQLQARVEGSFQEDKDRLKDSATTAMSQSTELIKEE